MHASAIAQVATGESNLEEVVVTGTRITSPGYQAPTPVTEISSQDLLLAAPGNLVTALSLQVPQFASGGANGGPAGTGGISTAQLAPTGNFLDLRDLGSDRLLVLMNGTRMPPSNYTDRVNADFIPQLLIDRVDVVTAGASAAYGSDAISGVVNFILDTKFNGVKGDFEGGVSGHGDNGNYRFGLAGGYQLNPTIHLLGSVEYRNQDGLQSSDRPLSGYNGQWTYQGRNIGSKATPGSAGNPYVPIVGAGNNLNPPSGYIDTGPLAGYVFNPDGSIRPYNPGTLTGTPSVSIGGDSYQSPYNNAIAPDYTQKQSFLRADIDFSDHVSGYLQGTWDQVKTQFFGLGSAVDFAPIYSGNPYLSPAIQSVLTATKTPSFLFSILTGPRVPPTDSQSFYNDRFYGIQSGLKGDFGKTWKWQADFVYGNTRSDVIAYKILYNKSFRGSLDAVVNPANGQTVCRVTLTNPTVFPGCIPWNILGPTAVLNTPDAVVDQNWGNPEYSSLILHKEAQAQISGEPFSLWAGPVSIAAGVEWRSEALSMTTNASPAPGYIDYTGIRGTTQFTRPFYVGNTGVGQGVEKVKEGFGEVAVPLLRDMPFAKAFDANGAIRVTDYSTSGSVTTWKYGGSYDPNEDIRFRITRSRDIRAPSLYELFGGPQYGASGVYDPHTNTTSIANVVTGGNPNLQPETSNTLTYGAILHPRFLPNFNFSIDYYLVNITGAINQISTASILQDCELEGGTGAACDLITRPLPYSNTTPANFPTSIENFPLNTSELRTSGVDTEASYRVPLPAGLLTLHFLGTYVLQYLSQIDRNQPIYNYAGGTEQNGLPKFKGVLGANYVYQNWTFYGQERFISGLTPGPQYFYDAPHIPAVFYTDLTFAYTLKSFGGDFNLFLTVNNLFDKQPPVVPVSTAFPGGAYSSLINIYDVIGRAFTLGVRFKF
jgi:outer membrane receptor protein involved in Fe transport